MYNIPVKYALNNHIPLSAHTCHQLQLLVLRKTVHPVIPTFFRTFNQTANTQILIMPPIFILLQIYHLDVKSNMSDKYALSVSFLQENTNIVCLQTELIRRYLRYHRA